MEKNYIKYNTRDMFSDIKRQLISRILPAQSIPEQYRRPFSHLFAEMAWIGVLSGSTLAFLSVYAARLGATPNQIGLISAAPAIVNLIFAIPVGGMIRGRPFGATAFWSSVIARIFYLPLAFLPILLDPGIEIWAIIAIILIMNLPLTVLNVSFNALMVEGVPADWRAFVVGGRNALLSILALVVTLISGQILKHVVFPLGYQIVFVIGFMGAMMSSFHLFFLRKFGQNVAPAIRVLDSSERKRWLPRLDSSPINRKYIRILLLLFCFHLSQWLVIPVVPLFSVNFLHLDDWQIGLGSGMFNLIVFIISFYLVRVTGRFGNHRSTGLSVIGLGLFPFLLAFTKGFPLYITANLIGGISWGILSGALFNYLAENMPEKNRAEKMSWYIVVSNASILIGSLLGPQIAGMTGFQAALLMFGILRIASGLAILRWG
jgi:hypothetical protein